jgi:branched-chain amino acid transport system substrate-binding protein
MQRMALIAIAALMLASCAGLPQKGQVEAGPGEPLTLGIAAALTGPLAAEGQGIVNAVTLAVERHGPLDGHPITVQTEDDGCDAATTEAAVTRLAALPRIIGVVGPTCSAGCVAAESPLDRRAVTMVSPRCTDIAVTRQGYEGVFRTAWTDAYDAVATSKFAQKTLDVKHVFMVNDGTVYARNLRDVFKIFFGKDNLAGNEEALTGSEDYGPVVRAIRKSAAGMIYYAGFPDDAVRFIHQVRAAGITLPIVLPDATLEDPGFAAALADVPGDVYVTSHVQQRGDDYDAFADAYRQRFGSEPTTYAAEAYDAALALLDSAQRIARNDDGRLTLDHRAMWDAMRRTDIHGGAAGRIRFRINGDRVEEATVRVLRVQDGALAPSTMIELE